jgi:hypothetical protein
VKIIALLNFYDEDPQILRNCVHSLGFCDHLVAVDGAYAMFPDAHACSPIEQVNALWDASKIPMTYSVPGEPYAGNEVEKRNALMRLGNAIADPGDWFLVIDADMVVTSVPSNLRAVLEQTNCMVGTYWLADSQWGGRHPIRYLFEAAPDLHITTTHYGYRRGDTYLWETGGLPAVETDLIIEHRGHERTPERTARADEYDRRVQVAGIETLNPV